MWPRQWAYKYSWCFFSGRSKDLLTLGEPCSDSQDSAEEWFITFFWRLPPVAGVERTPPMGVLPKITLTFALCPVFWEPATNIKQSCESSTPLHSLGTGVLTAYSHSFSSLMVECWEKVWPYPQLPTGQWPQHSALSLWKFQVSFPLDSMKPLQSQVQAYQEGCPDLGWALHLQEGSCMSALFSPSA